MKTRIDPEPTALIGLDYPPSPFAIPEGYRASLPANVQEWLADLEERVDGLALDEIYEGAKDFSASLSADSEHIAGVLRELGENVFFNRMQEILNLMGEGRLGIDVHWDKETSRIPGAAVEWALCKP